MLNCKKLAAVSVALALLVPLGARTRKGDQLISRGRAAEVRKQYDEALDLFEQALSEDPSDTAYQLAMRRVRFQAGQFHVERGMKLRTDGKTDFPNNDTLATYDPFAPSEVMSYNSNNDYFSNAAFNLTEANGGGFNSSSWSRPRSSTSDAMAPARIVAGLARTPPQLPE